jgi:phage baseplate assembly protein W
MASTINFKSVGTTGQKLIESNLIPSLTPIGIKTPLKLGKKYGIFDMYTNMSDTIHDNLRNLILTNWGERLGLYYFGANLRPLTTEYSVQEEFDSEAVIRIKTATATWMPYINLIDYVSDFESYTKLSSVAQIKLLITYSVPQLAVENRKLRINLFVL